MVVWIRMKERPLEVTKSSEKFSVLRALFEVQRR